MGILPFPFVFVTREKRTLQHPYTFEYEPGNYAKRHAFVYTAPGHIRYYPFAFDYKPQTYRKQYSFMYTASGVYRKQYPFCFRRQALIVQLDDEHEATRIVVQPIAVEHTLHAQRQTQLVDMYIHRQLIAQRAARGFVLQKEYIQHAVDTPILIDVSRAVFAMGYKGAPIYLTTAQAASMLHVVESRFSHAQFATSYQVLRTLLATQKTAQKHDGYELQIDQAQQVKPNDLYTIAKPNAEQVAVRPSDWHTDIARAEAAHQPSDVQITKDTDVQLTRVDVVETMKTKASYAADTSITAIKTNAERYATKGALDTTKDTQQHARRSVTERMVNEREVIATSMPIRRLHREGACMVDRVDIQHTHVERMIEVERPDTHTMQKDDIKRINRKLIVTTEVALHDTAARPDRHDLQREQPLLAKRERVEHLQSEQPLHAERTVCERISAEQPLHVERVTVAKTAMETLLQGERNRIVATTKDDELFGDSIDVIEADVDEEQSAVLYELFEAFVDEVMHAETFDVFIADIVEHLDATFIDTLLADIDESLHATSLDTLLTEIDEDNAVGTPEEERKKKLIWLIMGRPSWIMQWNQWKKTR